MSVSERFWQSTARLAGNLMQLGRGFRDLLFPGETGCCLCGGPLSSESPSRDHLAAWAGMGAVLDEELPICPRCQGAVGFPPDMPRCPNCARPLDGPWSLCPDCAAGSPLAGVAAVGLYRPPLSGAIIRLKYHNRPELAEPLGALLAEAVRRRWYPRHPGLPFAAAVPIPLHPARLRERGYNQAGELARFLSRRLGLPCAEGWLRRSQYTAAQARLGRRGRTVNIRSAFLARGVPPGAHLLLVDDVLTTGATARAAAEALRAAGAGRVSLAVVAVSPQPVW